MFNSDISTQIQKALFTDPSRLKADLNEYNKSLTKVMAEDAPIQVSIWISELVYKIDDILGGLKPNNADKGIGCLICSSLQIISSFIKQSKVESCYEKTKLSPFKILLAKYGSQYSIDMMDESTRRMLDMLKQTYISS